MKISNMRTTALISVLVVACLLGGQAAGTTISISPAEGVFVGPDQFVAKVMVDELSDMLGCSLTLGFDPEVVNPVSVGVGNVLEDAPCSLFFQWVNSADFVDTIELDVATLGCTANGAGILFQVVFEGVETGITPLEILSSELRDSNNLPIEHEVVPGLVSYWSEITTNISFQPEMVLFDEDGTGEICLYLEDVMDFLGMSVEFSFDPSVISPVSIEAGQALQELDCSFFLEWTNSGEFTNTVAIDTALLGCSGPLEGAVVCVTFQGVEYGESPLTWLEVDLRDSNNQPVLINTLDGAILYNSAVETVPTTMGNLKSIYR